MANIKVSEMTQANSVNDQDLLMIVQGSTNKKVTKQTLMEDVETELSGKVDKVEGKGLSTNDFTDAEKTKLDGIDLTDYVKNTDYATDNKGGVIKSSNSFAVQISNGFINSLPKTYTDYSSLSNYSFISKGTLENVITGKGLANNTQIQELQQENEKLKKALPQIKGTGTDITLNNTSDNKFNELVVKGNTEQEQLRGIPSPSPDFPQQIKNVTGNVNVKIQNKNLFNLTAQDFKNGTIVGFASKVFLGGLKPNTTYICSTNDTAQLGSNTTNLLFGGANSIVNGVNISSPKTATSNENGEVGVLLRTTNIDNFLNNYWVQIEEGSSATDYVPHQEQNLPLTLGNIELNKIDTAKDKFIKQNGKWYLHEENEKGTIGTATDLRTYGNNLKYAVYSRILANKPGINTTDFPTIIADKARGGKTFTENTIYIIDAGKSVVIFGSENDTLETFNQKFTGTNFKYILATPTDIEITDTTLISQLNAIENAMSYYEQTNISSTSDEIGAIIEANAVGDLNLIIS